MLGLTLTGHLFAWLWLIGPLGVCRATQIAVHDDLLRRPRQFIVKRSNDRAEAKLQRMEDKARSHPRFAGDWASADGWLHGIEFARHPWRRPYAYRAKLVTCPWCMSTQLALAVVAAIEVGDRVSWLHWLALSTLAILAALTFSLVAVIVDKAIDRLLPDEADDPDPPEEPPAGVRDVLNSLEG